MTAPQYSARIFREVGDALQVLDDHNTGEFDGQLRIWSLDGEPVVFDIEYDDVEGIHFAGAAE